MKNSIYILLSIIILSGCIKQKPALEGSLLNAEKLHPDSISHQNPVKALKGQTLYLPIYSSIPFQGGAKEYNLSGFVAVHNTDFHHSIIICKVLFLNNDGMLVKNFLNGDPIALKPMATTHFYIPESDTSGLGANFIIEWKADSTVNEPLIESVMLSLTHGQGVSFSSQGKVINEIK